ncbi:hypothetical protein GKJPGBOP_02163 [Streptomyces paromomycinus]|uniref:Uncharacterized protein n=1 Tax=Streptomyces paromomycinus TaxID=92743 RepID=A0A401VZI2_STREY|nr:hypothetical protein GKJPGBOP_02163 [Streptomyces paromomycinus]
MSLRRRDTHLAERGLQTGALPRPRPRATRLHLPSLVHPGRNSDQDQRHRAEEQPDSLPRKPERLSSLSTASIERRRTDGPALRQIRQPLGLRPLLASTDERQDAIPLTSSFASTHPRSRPRLRLRPRPHRPQHLTAPRVTPLTSHTAHTEPRRSNRAAPFAPSHTVRTESHRSHRVAHVTPLRSRRSLPPGRAPRATPRWSRSRSNNEHIHPQHVPAPPPFTSEPMRSRFLVPAVSVRDSHRSAAG